MDPRARNPQNIVANSSIESERDTVTKHPEPVGVGSQAVINLDLSTPIVNATSGATHLHDLTGPNIDSRTDANNLTRDGGDTKQTINTARPSRIATSVSPSASPNEERQNSNLTNHDIPDYHAHSHTSLHDELRKARIESTNKDNCYFMPVNRLDGLITLDSIYREIEMRKIGLEKDRSKIAQQIWDAPALPEVATRRKIFAVLALMEKVEAIMDFLREDVYDSALPFHFAQDQSVSSKRTEQPIELFQDKATWKPSEKDMFDKYQWEMMTPSFNLSPEGEKSIGQMPVEDRAVLPFTEVHSIETEGGFSVVRKVKIHSAHYNACDFPGSAEETYFAVKTLNFDADDKVLNNQEVQSLIRLNNENNTNLIRLLITFQHQKRVHLVFPWADGNLQDFWEKYYPDPHQPGRDSDLARWMTRQCLGLALGLQVIHHNSVDEPLVLENDLQSDALQKRHGRHGDFKPENVLWFRSGDSSSSNSVTGILKVSDFGFADFHASRSRSKVPLENLRGMTPTYRAPEWDVSEHVAPSYDLWCFGCVLLEFAEWYLRGWQGVKDFEEKRIMGSKHEIQGYREDNFFNNLPSPGRYIRKAVAKKAVHDAIHELRHHEKCSDFILDLLDFIEDYLLRMRPENRASCDNVVERLRKIHKRCEDNERYCTERKQPIRNKRTTVLSVIAHKWPKKYDEKGSGASPSRSSAELHSSNKSSTDESPTTAMLLETTSPEAHVLRAVEEQREDSESAQFRGSDQILNGGNANGDESIPKKEIENIPKNGAISPEEEKGLVQEGTNVTTERDGTINDENEGRRTWIKRSIIEPGKKPFRFLFHCFNSQRR